MKDPVIESKTNELQSLVDQVNVIMSDLQDLNVEVRIAYIDKNEPGYKIDESPRRQSIKLWKVEERNGYL
jgi:hypothetical protein